MVVNEYKGHFYPVDLNKQLLFPDGAIFVLFSVRNGTCNVY